MSWAVLYHDLYPGSTPRWDLYNRNVSTYEETLRIAGVIGDHAQRAILVVDNDVINTPRDTANGWSTRIPHASDLPHGYRYFGRYWTGSIIGDDIQIPHGQESLSCPHCAIGVNNEVLVLVTGGDLRSSYRESEGEIAGTEPVWTCGSASTIDVPNSCGLCGQLGHNRATCNRAWRTYSKVGIEIEGRWWRDGWRDSIVPAINRYGARHCSDGSVRHHDGFWEQEIQTAPGTLREALLQLRDMYPHHTGPDCGMHVHVSFTDRTVFTQLATEKFYSFFRARWEVWGARHNLSPSGQFFSRLRGENEYCQPNCDDSYSDDMTLIDRYHQLNFSAYKKHSTVECRLLPMFVDPNLAINAVQELLSIYEDFLAGETLELAHEQNFNEPALIADHTDAHLPDELFEFVPFDGETAVAVPEYQDPDPGMRRVITTPDSRQYLRDIGFITPFHT